MAFHSIFSVDWSNYQKTDQPCPKCGKGLWIEENSFIEVARCKNCGFEGGKDPFIKAARIGLKKVIG